MQTLAPLSLLKMVCLHDDSNKLTLDSLADAEALLDDENPSDTATTEAATENKPAIDASQKKTEVSFSHFL